MKRALTNDRGLTLIEVLGAAFILSVAIISLYALSQFSFGSNHRTDAQAKALHFAEQKLNETRYALMTQNQPIASIETSGHFSENENYHYHIDIVPFTGSDIELDNPFTHRNIASMQSVVYTDEGASLVTVIVSWGENR